MELETNLNDTVQDLAPDEQPVRKETRPRFDPSQPMPGEVTFKKEIQDKPPAPPAPETFPVVVSPDEESTALVKVERSPTEIVPFEIDYSNYATPQYQRVDPKAGFNLRSVQAEGIEAFFNTPLRRPIVVLPTGCGKTVAGLTIAGRINGRVLWIAHRNELIDQPAEEVKALFPDLQFGIERGSVSTGAGKRLVIASIQTLQGNSRLKKVMSGAPISLVVYDECHHATAASSIAVLTKLGCLRKDGKGPKLLGLTATPKRSDKTSLGTIFEDIIYSCSIQKAIALGFLVPPKVVKVYLPINKKALRSINNKDYNPNEMDRELARVNAAQATAAAILANCADRKTIVFCISINQAKRTAEACRKLGIKAAWASGEGTNNADGDNNDDDEVNGMTRRERRRVLKAFTNNKIQVVVCAELLTEGYDEKSISAVVIARPTKSQGRYQQMAGRGLRTCEHKTDCILIDITGDNDLDLVGGELLLQKPIDKTKKKSRPSGPTPTDSNTEWLKLQSYLRNARVLDVLEHGELTFARANDDMLVTVAKDRELVIVRRVAKDGADQWVIEHGGLVYTPEPLTFIEALAVCDTLLPTFGGGVKPGSVEWDAAADRPTPPPAVQPGGHASEPSSTDVKPETTRISEPESKLPLAMNFAGGSDISDLAEQVTKDLLNSNAAAFAKGLRHAIKAGKCHLLGIDREPPTDFTRWGWLKAPGGVKPAGAGSLMIGWVYGDTAFVDPASVSLAQDQIKSLGDEHEIRVKYLRKHLGTLHRLFMGEKKDWIKIRTEDIDPTEKELVS